MKLSVTRLVLLSLALVGAASADLPKKVPLNQYNGLWNNSPFTSKPPVAEDGPTVNPLEDYALIGVSPIGKSSYRVTLINKKTPGERIIVDSDNSKSGFKILSINRKDGDPLGTVVHMSSGTATGTVSFDEKLLTLTTTPTAKAAPPAQPGQIQPQAQPGQPQPQAQPGQPTRQPRPRVVPPASGMPNGGPTAAPFNRTNNGAPALRPPTNRLNRRAQ
jgi:hypothetical protein